MTFSIASLVIRWGYQSELFRRVEIVDQAGKVLLFGSFALFSATKHANQQEQDHEAQEDGKG